MCSFAPNMYNHVALQTKRGAIHLTVKESYMHIMNCAKNLVNSTRRVETLTVEGRMKNNLPGEFSHMSQLGTAWVSIILTLTWRFASLLHK